MPDKIEGDEPREQETCKRSRRSKRTFEKWLCTLSNEIIATLPINGGGTFKEPMPFSGSSSAGWKQRRHGDKILACEAGSAGLLSFNG